MPSRVGFGSSGGNLDPDLGIFHHGRTPSRRPSANFPTSHSLWRGGWICLGRLQRPAVDGFSFRSRLPVAAKIGVDDGRRDGRSAGLADAAGGFAALDDMNLDLRGLVDAHRPDSCQKFAALDPSRPSQVILSP